MVDPIDPITVMIVDDHEMVRRGACSYLEAQPDIALVAQAGTGEEAVRLAREFIPDVVLMDLLMPDMDGIEATRRVKNVSPRTQIVILTSFHQDEYVFPAFKAGAILVFAQRCESCRASGCDPPRSPGGGQPASEDRGARH